MEKLTNEYKIEFTKGDTYALAIKFKNITEDLRSAFFTVKENADDTPLIQKILGAGIDKIDDRAYKNEKTYKFQLQPADTVNLEARVQYLYDIQVVVGNVVKTVLRGVFELGNTVTGTSVTTTEMEVAIDDELETELSTTPATNGVEYEQDPVACVKIGDLEILKTAEKESVVKAINEVHTKNSTNAEKINNIENGTTVTPNVKNVTEQINGKNITDIFEADGVTVKKATKSDEATTSGTAGHSTTANKSVNLADGTFGVIEQDENGVIKINNVVIPYEKAVYTPETADNITVDGLEIECSENITGSEIILEILPIGTSSTYTDEAHLLLRYKLIGNVSRSYKTVIGIIDGYPVTLGLCSKNNNILSLGLSCYKDLTGYKVKLYSIYKIVK